MKTTDFVSGKKYVDEDGEVLEYSHSNNGDVLFFFMVNLVSMHKDYTPFDQWKEYNEPKKASADYLPDGITRDQLTVHKYAVGDKLAMAKGLTIDNFEDGIQAVKWSQNPNEKSKFLHCHGFNKQSGQFTFFICKLKS